MFKPKTDIVIAITTFDVDALRVSLPPLRRLHERFTLIIHNDNPAIELRRSMVRKLYPRGKIHIINSEQNRDELESRIRIIEFIRAQKIPCDWIMFADDDDVLIDCGMPSVDKNKFAVVQNVTTLYESLIDVFKISHTWVNGAPIGKTGPHFDINGTLIRANILFEFAECLRGIYDSVDKLVQSTKYRMPVSSLLWTGLNSFVRIRHPEMSPIYMNRTNYVAIKLGNTSTKYGRTAPTGATAQKAVADITKKFTKLIELAAAQNMVAENQ